MDLVGGQAALGEPRIEFRDMGDPANILRDAGFPLHASAPLIVFVFASPVRVSTANPAASGAEACPGGSPNCATQGTVAIVTS